MKKFLFTDFLQNLSAAEIPLAVCIDDLFLQSGCTHEVKESASGYTVSYISIAAKKTVANFVCRKNGLKIRLTPQKPFVADGILETCPENMQNDAIRAAVCKRLSDPNACNPKCVMGYAFTLKGESYQKCRSMAFLFAVTEENLPHIVSFMKKFLTQ